MLEPVEKVAVLALVYREMYRNQYSSAVSLDEDMASCPDEINLIGVIGSQQLADEDWVLIAFIGERSFPAEEIGRDLTEWSASRCEALLHAWPEDPREDLGDAEWAQPFLPRWELVAARMAGLEPLTWDREQRRDVYAAVSGQPLGEVLEDEQAVERMGDRLSWSVAVSLPDRRPLRVGDGSTRRVFELAAPLSATRTRAVGTPAAATGNNRESLHSPPPLRPIVESTAGCRSAVSRTIRACHVPCDLSRCTAPVICQNRCAAAANSG